MNKPGADCHGDNWPAFSDAQTGTYWSSTTNVLAPAVAWYVSLYGGSAGGSAGGNVKTDDQHAPPAGPQAADQDLDHRRLARAVGPQMADDLPGVHRALSIGKFCLLTESPDYAMIFVR